MSITSDQSELLLKAARAKAVELGVAVSIAVVDPGGNLKAFSRMDGAWLGASDVAVRKAKTSVLFEAETQDLAEVCKPGGAAQGLELTNDLLITFAGGIPLGDAHGNLVGSIGVSGARVSQDYAIAQTAQAAFMAWVGATHPDKALRRGANN